ncbi:MAG: HD domain-containing phosphohydrolase [Candidatus Brocadiales bacterium]|nr:HD domain-containing phosphohydrolase [Candidatus Brocadiales bacterium]
MIRPTRFGIKLFCWLLLVSLPILSAVSISSFIYIRGEIKKSVTKELKFRVDDLIQHLSALLKAGEARVTDFSSDGFIRDCARKLSFLGMDEETSSNFNRHLLLNKKSLDPSILEVSILNSKGIVIGSSSPEEVGKDKSQADYFQRPYIFFEETGVYFSGAMRSSQDPTRFELVFSRTLTDKDTTLPLGVIAIVIDGRRIENLLHSYTIQATGAPEKECRDKIFLLSEDMLALFVANEVMAGEKVLNIDLVQKAVAIRGAASGIYKDEKGEKIIGSARFIPGVKWVVLFERELAEVFEPLRTMKYIFIGGGAIALTTILILAITISKGTNTALSRLTEGTKRIALGNLEEKIEVKRRDEIGTLAISFNSMMQELRASYEKREELFSAVERSKKEWEQTFDSIEDMVVVLDRDLRISRANMATLRYAGLDFNEIIGKTHYEVFPFCKGPKCPVTGCNKSLKPVDAEIEDNRTGNIFLASAFPLIGPEGEHQRTVINIMRNITEQKRASQELEARRITAMIKLAELAEKRDPTTGGHLRRVGEYCQILCQELKKWSKYHDRISDAFMNSIKESSLLHDIGKVAVPDAILLKNGNLSKEEFEMIKIHTIIGAETLTGPEYFATAREICRSHHERYDGSGYPDGLKGDDIPLPAQIVGLADMYDALTSKRPYREALSHEEACRIIQDESGKHFNPDIVSVFINIRDDFYAVSKRYSDQESTGG